MRPFYAKKNPSRLDRLRSTRYAHSIMKTMNRLFLAASLFTLAALPGCVNLFDPIDNPGGEQQLLSAARAAFDKGDIATARELYGKAGGEASISELVFVDLDSCGADIAAFATALSRGSSGVSGTMLTVMGEKMNPQVSTACFATLLAAYKSSLTITDANLRGFTSYMAALAIAGEVIGTNSGITANAILEVADIYGTPSTCAASCAGCPKADGISAAAAVTLSSASSITAAWGTLKGAINAATTALSDLQISTGPSSTLVSAFNASDPTNDATFRCILAQIGVGR